MLQKIKEKLSKSSSYYSDLVNRKVRDYEIYSGNYWTDDTIANVDRVGRICRSFNMYAKFMNAIVSPFSKSPWHCEIEDPDGIYKEIQENIDDIENETNCKYVFTERSCLRGSYNRKYCLRFPKYLHRWGQRALRSHP